MQRLLANIKIQVPENLFVKDPESSDLGKKILKHSIQLIDELGFEGFTFKKLGEQIQSNESSIYRYFENKHKLLLYLSSWYWGWLEYKLVFGVNNLQNPADQLNKAIEIITEKPTEDENDYFNKGMLFQIVISEFSKSYLTKFVDEENKEGYFLIYKNIVYRLTKLIQGVNEKYPYQKSLASTIVEGALHQHFLSCHLKSITDCHQKFSPADFYKDLAERTLKK
jgi:AcrR family transcriptional regulator